jgi:hypothetical protein
MANEVPQARTWFGILGWIVAVGCLLGNLLVLGYIAWSRTLSGAAYAQADFGLFMLLLRIGVPIALLSIGVIVLGCALRPPPIDLSTRGIRDPLVILLGVNLGVVVLSWIYLLFLMP